MGIGQLFTILAPGYSVIQIPTVFWFWACLFCLFTDMKSVRGGPDPTLGGAASEQTSWCLDAKNLKDNIKKILIKFCVPAPIVFRWVQVLCTASCFSFLDCHPFPNFEPEVHVWKLNILNFFGKYFRFIKLTWSIFLWYKIIMFVVWKRILCATHKRLTKVN